MKDNFFVAVILFAIIGIAGSFYMIGHRRVDLSEVYSTLVRREIKIKELETEVEQQKEMIYRCENIVREMAEKTKGKRGRR